jgi:hypothetical protein
LTTSGDAQPWLVVFVLLVGLAGLIVVFALARVWRPGRAPTGPTSPVDPSLHEEVTEIRTRLEALEQGVARVADTLPRSVQGVGVVRYNPFPDMGSNMSFSLALLDGRANGVVVSVLTNRDGSRVFGKMVENGTSSYPLSDEERQALALAQGNRA